MQFPKDSCDNYGWVVYNFPPNEGWGGVLLNAASSLAFAYHTGRILALGTMPLPYGIPKDKCKGNQWGCFFEPISKCDESMLEEKEAADLRARQYGYHFEMTKEGRESFTQKASDNMFDMNRFKHRTIHAFPFLGDASLYTCPAKYRDRVSNCPLWFASEMMRFVRRLRPDVRAKVDAEKARIASHGSEVNAKTASMHVRQGDAIDDQVELRHLGYVMQAQYGWDTHIDLAVTTCKRFGIRTVFVATDDKKSDVYEPKLQQRGEAEGISFVMSNFGKFSRSDTDATVQGAENPQRAFVLALEGLVDISVLSECSVFVGSASSTFGVFASHSSYSFGSELPKYVDSNDIANEKYKFFVVAYMPLIEHTFSRLSKMFRDPTGTRVRWDSRASAPKYDAALISPLLSNIRRAPNEKWKLSTRI